MELNELRKTAEAATPGPWTSYGYRVETVPEFDLHRFDVMGEMVADCDLLKSDARHIAAFDPTTVLALLSRLEQAEQAVQRVRETHRPVDVEPSETICHACSTLRGNGDSLRYFPYKEWPCDTIRALDGDGRG